MSIHLQRKIDALRHHLTGQIGAVEDAVAAALDAVNRRDAKLARKLVVADDIIDMAENEIEEECLKVLALEQPVAGDLRFVVTVLKINNDLERIADMAVNLAEQAIFLADCPPLELGRFLGGMPEEVRQMLSVSLESLLELDAGRANEVRAADDRVDALHRRMYREVEAAMRAEPDQVPHLLHVLTISKNLERMADLATNIAEDVIYMVRGEIVRHSS